MKNASCVYMPSEWMPYYGMADVVPYEQLRSGINKHMHLAQSTTVILQRCVDGCVEV